MRHLILGGARSGKSRLAEELALSSGRQSVYIATGWAGDEEMAKRITAHQQQRGSRWSTIEEQLDLAGALAQIDGHGKVILVDCLTLWLSNALHHQVWSEQKQAFLDVLPTLQSDVYLVSNEVGSGIVPMGELSRTFADEAGRLNQDVARLCEKVTLVVAGLPLVLKPTQSSVD